MLQGLQPAYQDPNVKQQLNNDIQAADAIEDDHAQQRDDKRFADEVFRVTHEN